MDRKLFVVNQYCTKYFDSNIYKEIFNYEIQDFGNNKIKNRIYMQDVVGQMIEYNVNELLFVVHNEQNYLFQLLILEIIKEIDYQDGLKMYLLPEYCIEMCEKNSVIIENYYVEIDWRKPRLDQFQVHLTDICNLKCKGCGHYCSITTDPNLLDVEEYTRDIGQIKKKFWGVQRIYLLGGEPLLHPCVWSILDVTREMFKDTDVRLSTNGLLLTKQSQDFWNSVRKNHIHIEISLYAPTKEMFSEIEDVLKENSVWETTIFLNGRESFFKQLLLHADNNPGLSFQKCVSHSCHFLRNGHLALCPAVYLGEFFYNEYGLERPYIPDGIDLYDESIDGWSINQTLSKPSVACSYCSSEPQSFKWEKSSKEEAKIEDWIVDCS